MLLGLAQPPNSFFFFFFFFSLIGPVMAIIKFKDVHEVPVGQFAAQHNTANALLAPQVVRRANDSIYGLVAAVYTRDVEKAMFLSKKLKAGTVWVNTYNVITPQTPWGTCLLTPSRCLLLTVFAKPHTTHDAPPHTQAASSRAATGGTCRSTLSRSTPRPSA